MATDAAAATPHSRRGPFLLVLLAVIVVAALVGAYLDWRLWLPYVAIVTTLVAIALLVVGGIVAIVPRRLVRRIGLVVVAVGLGLLLGQAVGPSRPELIGYEGGSMTIRLTSPVAGTATGPAGCQNVASGTDFQISGDPNIRLDTDRSFFSAGIEQGDRWSAVRDGPHAPNGVWLVITISPTAVTEEFPSEVQLVATERSTVDATFSNEGGHLTFANLESRSGANPAGVTSDLAGSIEWTCGEPFGQD
jgi:hypothetical protein